MSGATPPNLNGLSLVQLFSLLSRRIPCRHRESLRRRPAWDRQVAVARRTQAKMAGRHDRDTCRHVQRRSRGRRLTRNDRTNGGLSGPRAHCIHAAVTARPARHTPPMPATRPRRAPVVSALALLLVSSLTTGCGESAPSGGADRLHGAPARPAAPAALAASAATPTVSASARTVARAARDPAAKSPRARRPIPPAHPVPAAFRPAPGASSDAEVRSELAQMEAIQHRQRQAALSAAAANLAGLLPWAHEPRSGLQSSVASVFTDYGLGLACGGVLGRSELGVAHKTAPCGTLITFTYAGRSLTVPVIDRGPYIVGREWDLTGATAAALGFPGLGSIEWSVAG